ncbi:MAG: helix-turn-helix transcriptional regulator [Chloroflexota bacterium]
MRASRLVALLLLLQTRGRMTADEIAAELEVSPRTVYRDLDALGAAGVPVYAERGPGGGLQLVEGYRTRLTGLNADEAQALFLAGLPGPAAELGLGTVLAAAQLKVLAALPPELRSRASRIRERFHLVVPGWFQRAKDAPHLATVAGAVWEERRLRMTYRREGELVERVVDPLGLVLKAGTWYVVARRDDLLRTYRASRIVEAEALSERFERPAAFDLASFWSTAESDFEESMGRVDVTLRIHPDAVGTLSYVIGATRVDEAVESAPRDDEGWLRLTVRLESVEWAHDDLLRLGPRAEVLDPPELRTALAATSAAMAARYRSAARAGGDAVSSPTAAAEA